MMCTRTLILDEQAIQYLQLPSISTLAQTRIPFPYKYELFRYSKLSDTIKKKKMMKSNW